MPGGYLLFLFILLFASVVDAEFTTRKISALGDRIEHNTFIRRLVQRFGPRRGTWIGIFIPTVVIAVLGWWIHDLLVFVAGARTTLLSFQVLELDRIRTVKDAQASTFSKR